MSDPSPHEERPLSPGRGLDRSGMSFDEVWAGYLTMGGTATRAEVKAALDGHGVLDSSQHDRLAAALNEQFVAIGEDHPVAYHDEPAPDAT